MSTAARGASAVVPRSGQPLPAPPEDEMEAVTERLERACAKAEAER